MVTAQLENSSIMVGDQGMQTNFDSFSIIWTDTNVILLSWASIIGSSVGGLGLVTVTNKRRKRKRSLLCDPTVSECNL